MIGSKSWFLLTVALWSILSSSSPAEFSLTEIDGVPYESLPGLVSRQFCSDYIARALKEAWDTTNDSVDRLPQFTIDVFDHGRVENPNLWNLLRPKLGSIEERLRKRFPGQAKSLDWVFLRKYAEGERTKLQAHKDVSTLSVIVPLNVDYEGGELYFIRKNSSLHALDTPEMPTGAARNSSDFYFPYLQPGSASLYDNSVYHGIRTVTRGAKFSLVLFYDMPAIDGDASCHLFFNAEFDEPYAEKKNWNPGEAIRIDTFVGHNFFITDAKTERKIHDIKIKDKSPHLYVVREQNVEVLPVDSEKAIRILSVPGEKMPGSGSSATSTARDEL